jgi:tetratricopeptide (TPR) repeat protein
MPCLPRDSLSPASAVTAPWRRGRLLSTVLAAALLGGCATTDPVDQSAGAEAQQNPAETVAAAPATPPPPPVPERPIPEASVYPLLVAEFALRRRDFDTALALYLQQAEILRDPAVSKHATNLAQYLQREREAFRAVRLWVDVEPENVEANATLATLLARQGRTLEAMPHLALVARSGEAAKWPLLLNRFKALPAAQQRALDDGVRRLLDEEFADNNSLLLTYALMAEEAGDPERALERLQPVFAREPFQAQAVLMEAKILLAAGDEAPFARLQAALEDDPQRSQLRLQYARLLTRTDMTAARQQFEILSAEAPGNTDLLFSLALLNHELKDNVAAKAYLREVLDTGERTDEAYFFLGQIAMGEADLDAALDHFRQVGDGQHFLNATANIGRILLDRARDDELADYMARLRSSYPNRGEQLYALEASLLGDAQRDERSLRLLDEAIAAYPEADNLYYARSILHERSGDIAAAERDLRAIIARDAENATALNALGYTLANRTDRLDEARSLIERALALDPNEPAILDSMGWVLFRQGDYDRALNYLTRAYASFPDPEVAAHLGEVMWVSGNTAGAMQVWRGALREDPQHRVLNETLDRLGVSLQALGTP